MKRWLVVVVFYLFAGALTTAAIAWGIALFVEELHPGDFSEGGWLLIDHKDGPRRAALAVYTSEGFGTQRTHFHVWSWVTNNRNVGVDQRLNSRYEPVAHLPHQEYREHLRRRLAGVLENGENKPEQFDARGWPFLALWCEPKGIATSQTAAARSNVRIDEYGGIAVFDDGLNPVSTTLPYLPIWHGALLNSLIYAFAWFALVFGLKSARRGVRRLRKCCPQCSYKLHVECVQGCPECGWNRDAEEAPPRP